MTCFFHVGWFPFGRRKVGFTFNLTALKVATAVCRLDLGEFYTSEKLSDDHRFFYHTFGAWLNGREYTPELFKQYVKLYARFNTKHLTILKQTIASENIVSTQLLNALKRTTEKKN